MAGGFVDHRCGYGQTEIAADASPRSVSGIALFCRACGQTVAGFRIEPG